MPGTDGQGYIASTQNYLGVAVKAIAVGRGFTNFTPVRISLGLSLLSHDDTTVYNATSKAVEVSTTLGGTPLTMRLKLDPKDSEYIVVDEGSAPIASLPRNIEPNWYKARITITITPVNGTEAEIGFYRELGRPTVYGYFCYVECMVSLCEVEVSFKPWRWVIYSYCNIPVICRKPVGFTFIKL